MSPLPSAASPTRTSPRRPSVSGRSHATPGSPYHLTPRPRAARTRGEITSRGPVPGYQHAHIALSREAVMPLVDVYGRTHELDTKSLDSIATRLEARRDSTRYMGMLREYLDAIDLTGAQRVLALGCGTGAEVREVLRRSNFQGRVTAIDISADLVERGKGLAEQEGFAGRIEWLVGDAQELSLPDGFFDLVLAHTLVSHLPEPKRIVQQAARVVRPGGTVVILTAT